MNNKGFTLIELLATIMLLVIISSVATVSVVSFINASKDKSYKILIENIKVGSQEYFEECENVNIIDSALPDNACNIFASCSDSSANKCATFNLESLLDYGFITSTATNKDDSGTEITIVDNPKTNENMNNCVIEVLKYVNNDKTTWYEIKSKSTNSFCPKTDELSN